ncbi:uncharacterized protein LOC134256464 [Saccostrea cucullata]|uniref:uncharacterized protein LOC134256464 n=1 Tax=Saccostrea cuccullata TaxID=36930 RepID=UPI002ED52AB5
MVNYIPSIHMKLTNPNTTMAVLSDVTTEVSTLSNTASVSPSMTIYQNVSKTNSFSGMYVCPTFKGRLGNNLFQFASGFGIAVSMGLKVVIGENDTVYKMFEMKNSKYLLISKEKEECINAKARIERRICIYDDRLVNLTPNETFRVGDYLQSWKYFHNDSRELREQFKIRDHLKNKVDHIINGIVEKFNTT